MQTLIETADALGLNHIQIIVRDLYAIAHCDEVHQSEQVMIKNFYDACREEAVGLADFLASSAAKAVYSGCGIIRGSHCPSAFAR